MATSASGASATDILYKCLAGGIGCGASGFITNPMDVIKIKNQQHGGDRFGTFTGAARTVLNEEGPVGFLKGAAASVLRELTYSAFRMGMYDPIKDGVVALTGQSTDSPSVKWSAAFLSGAVGSAMFVPVDLVKVRFQSRLPGLPKPYPSIPRAFLTIYREENGLAGLYNGTAPTVVRAAFLTCAQLGSYDVIKNNILVEAVGMDKESVSTHLAASLAASVVTTTAANPADVVKTRAMNDASGGAPGGSARHFRAILRDHGPAGFMKGWTASYLRIGPHTVISFLLIERIRQLMGMGTY